MKREKLWVVRPGDGPSVRAILVRAREDVAAVAEGRVFVGKRRVTDPDRPVSVGDAVRIGAPDLRSTPSGSIVLFVRDGLVACFKPAGLPTVPDHAGSSHALVALAAAETGAKDLRVTSRLDREVSGVVVFAMDAASEDRLRRARALGEYHRRYVALAAGDVPDAGTWDTPIGRGPDPRLRRALGDEAKAAVTRFQTVATAMGIALVAVTPETGRTHQIRVHASHAGAPLVGDRDYGGPKTITLPSGRVVALDRVALHAAHVRVPGEHGPIDVRADPPAALTAIWAACGGGAAAWRDAMNV